MTYYEWLHRCLMEESRRYTFRIPPDSPLWTILNKAKNQEKKNKLER